MNTNGVFDYPSYRNYLKDRLGEGGARSGLKKKAATYMGAHTTLISQVISGGCHLSLEHAEKMNTFLDHNKDEASYFISLILWERAGTIDLKARFQEQLNELKQKRFHLNSRLSKDHEVNEIDKEKFYSTYLYAAIHILTSIPEYKNIPALSEALGISHGEIFSAITFLKRIKVIKETNGVLAPGSKYIHLGNESKSIINHHLNWRFRAIEAIRREPAKDLHYSGIMSLSNNDITKIKEILVDAIKIGTDTAVNSKEEVAYIMCIDFFKMR